MEITNELLSAYAEGNVSLKERIAVRQFLTEHPKELESVLIMMDDDYDITLDNDDLDLSLNVEEEDLALNKDRAEIKFEGYAHGLVMNEDVSDTHYDGYAHDFVLNDNNLNPHYDCLCNDIDTDDYDLDTIHEYNDISTSHNTKCLDYQLRALIDELNPMSTNSPNFRILPAIAKAARNTVDNLCAIRCEGIALRRYGIEISDDALLEESKQQGWLTAEGTALHNIGNLTGSRGLGISHRYECSINDINEALTAGHIVLAAIDSSKLKSDKAERQEKDKQEGEQPDHVVIIEAIDDDVVKITDPSTTQQYDSYPLQQFLDAWEDSSRYIIIISDGQEYDPHPIDLTGVEVSDELIELREAIAENAHEVWAYNRKQEGWTYGAERDDQKKLHPDMVAYNQLSESEKQYDREMAMNTIKLLKKLGWELKKELHATAR